MDILLLVAPCVGKIGTSGGRKSGVVVMRSTSVCLSQLSFPVERTKTKTKHPPPTQRSLPAYNHEDYPHDTHGLFELSPITTNIFYRATKAHPSSPSTPLSIPPLPSQAPLLSRVHARASLSTSAAPDITIGIHERYYRKIAASIATHGHKSTDDATKKREKCI